VQTSERDNNEHKAKSTSKITNISLCYNHLPFSEIFYDSNKCYRKVQIPAECLELFDYLLNEIHQVKVTSIDEHLDPADIAISQRPISEWLDTLKNEGFNIELFGKFMLSDEINRLWNGDISIREVYKESIENNFSTRQFLEAIYIQDSSFQESLLKDVLQCLSERAILLNTAGGVNLRDRFRAAGSTMVDYYNTALEAIRGWIDREFYTEVVTIDMDFKIEQTNIIYYENKTLDEIVTTQLQRTLPNEDALRSAKTEFRRDKMLFSENPEDFVDNLKDDQIGKDVLTKPKDATKNFVSALTKDYLESIVHGFREEETALVRKFQNDIKEIARDKFEYFDHQLEYHQMKECEKILKEGISVGYYQHTKDIVLLFRVEESLKPFQKMASDAKKEVKECEDKDKRLIEKGQKILKDSQTVSFFASKYNGSDRSLADAIERLDNKINLEKGFMASTWDNFKKREEKVEELGNVFTKHKCRLEQIEAEIDSIQQKIIDINKLKFEIDNIKEFRKIFKDTSESLTNFRQFEVKEDHFYGGGGANVTVELDDLKKLSDISNDENRVQFIDEKIPLFNEQAVIADKQLYKKTEGFGPLNNNLHPKELIERKNVLVKKLKILHKSREEALKDYKNWEKKVQKGNDEEKRVAAEINEYDDRIKKLEKAKKAIKGVHYARSCNKDKLAFANEKIKMANHTIRQQKRLLRLDPDKEFTGGDYSRSAVKAYVLKEAFKDNYKKIRFNFKSTLERADRNAFKDYAVRQMREEYGTEIAKHLAKKLEWASLEELDKNQIEEKISADCIKLITKQIDDEAKALADDEIEKVLKSVAQEMFTDMFNKDFNLANHWRENYMDAAISSDERKAEDAKADADSGPKIINVWEY